MAERGGLKPHTLVDCGYVRHPMARANADKLLKYVGKGNVQIAGYNRLLVHIPKTKLGILKRFRSIRTFKAVPGYCDTTHTFGRGPQFDLKWAR